MARSVSRSSTTQAKYWYAELPNHGVKLPGVGVQIRVLAVNGTTMLVLAT